VKGRSLSPQDAAKNFFTGGLFSSFYNDAFSQKKHGDRDSSNDSKKSQ
jgi:hypothetical protein